MANAGDRINPYSVSFAGKDSISEFSTHSFRVELRRGVHQGKNWIWLRTTTLRSSNCELGATAKIVPRSVR